MGCNQVDEKRAMTRIVFSDGALRIDREQTAAGRGGYLHDEPSCLQRFQKSKVGEFRSLRRRVAIAERARVASLIGSAGSEPQSAELR